MRCEDVRILLSGLVDGELTPEEKKHAGDHMTSCDDCRNEYARMKKLKEVTAEMKYLDISDKLLAGYWQGVYRRIERGLGWILLSVGAIMLLAFGAWELLNDFLLDQQTPLFLKIGVGTLLLGTIVLLISIIRERLFSRKHDRYEEVKI